MRELVAINRKVNTGMAMVRNHAILLVGYFGGFRRSEVAGILFDNIEFSEEGMKINILNSKTDQKKEGVEKAIAYNHKDPAFCPVRAIKDWIDLAKIDGHAVFRRLSKKKQLYPEGTKSFGKPLSGNAINEIIKELSSQLGWSFVDSVSSHSLRRGVATSAARKNASIDQVMALGGWKSDQTARGYIDEGTAMDRSATKLLYD